MTDYDWLIPHSRPMRWLYRLAERHAWAYVVTWPVWFGRFHWLRRR